MGKEGEGKSLTDKRGGVTKETDHKRQEGVSRGTGKKKDGTETRKSRKQVDAKKDVLSPDIVMKEFWGSNQRFADLVNGICFHGKRVILPEELSDGSTEQSFLTVPGGDGEWDGTGQGIVTVRLRRDLLKRQAWDMHPTNTEPVESLGIHIILWAAEPQMYIDYAMPLRLMGYDYSDYKTQYDRNAEKFTEEWMKENHIVGNERLSRMMKTDRLAPVISICVYLGEKPWDGPRNLKDMLFLPEELADLVNDYPMRLFDVRRADSLECFLDENNRDLFCLLQIASDRSMKPSERKSSILQYNDGNGVSPEVARAFCSLTSRKTMPNIIFDKEEVPMDELAQYIFDEGKEEGREEGREEQRKENMARDERMAIKMFRDGDKPEKIAYVLERTIEQVCLWVGTAHA